MLCNCSFVGCSICRYGCKNIWVAQRDAVKPFGSGHALSAYRKAPVREAAGSCCDICNFGMCVTENQQKVKKHADGTDKKVLTKNSKILFFALTCGIFDATMTDRIPIYYNKTDRGAERMSTAMPGRQRQAGKGGSPKVCASLPQGACLGLYKICAALSLRWSAIVFAFQKAGCVGSFTEGMHAAFCFV